VSEVELELDHPRPPAVDEPPPVPARAPAELLVLESKQRQRMHVRLLTIAGDTLAIAAAFVTANLIRFGDPLHSQGLNMISVFLLIYLPTALNGHAYSISNLVKARNGASRAVMSLFVAIGAIGLVVFFLKVSTDFSRAVFGTGAILSLIAVPASRLAIAGFARRLFTVSTLNEVIIEDGIAAGPVPGAVVLNAQRLGLSPRLDDPEMFDRMSRYLKNADRVIVACPLERRPAWAFAMKGADVHAEVFAPEVEALGPLGISRVGASQTLVIATGPLALADRIVKRVFDLALTIVSLPVVLPLAAAIALAIRLESRGPIIFVQKRVGLGNRLFRTYKFRSMYVDRLDLSGTRSTGRHDDRVTRVGRFIRAHSLDELPQLFNVLRGDMSIVGPRPHALGSRAEDKLFWDIETSYWHRHAVKPGLTGLAQIRGYRGSTETVTDLSNRLQADLEYLSGWSIWRDIAIAAATFRVLFHRNAY
jgi:lipopolysaccharide/colanic/teichoic acid biosynthesis glycosyltransferase